MEKMVKKNSIIKQAETGKIHIFNYKSESNWVEGIRSNKVKGFFRAACHKLYLHLSQE